jgi:hypothetical protein
MSLPKFNKLYFPGLISLVFLPMIIAYYLIGNNAFYKPVGMRIAWADKEFIRKNNVETFRKYEIISITGDIRNDGSGLKRLQAELNKIVANNDTKDGIEVLFGNHSNYAELITTLDICFSEKDKNLAFSPSDNKLFIAQVRPSTQPKTSLPPRFIQNDIICGTVSEIPEQSFMSIEWIKTYLSKAFRFTTVYWPAMLAFILMLIFALNKRRRFLDLRHFRLVGN